MLNPKTNVVHLKPIQNCKSTILQFKKKTLKATSIVAHPWSATQSRVTRLLSLCLSETRTD